jgi:hypothetical protein
MEKPIKTKIFTFGCFLFVNAIILTSGVFIVSAWESKSISQRDNMQLEISVKGSAETIFLGDPLYVICTFTNKGENPIENIPISYEYFYDDYRLRYFECDVIFPNNFIYKCYPEDDGGKPSIDRPLTQTKPLNPNESRIMFDHTFELPPLEDWRHPQWKNFCEKIDNDSITCELRFRTRCMYSVNPDVMNCEIKRKITIKRRPLKETNIINDWFEKCRKEHFPIVIDNDSSGRQVKLPANNARYTNWDNNFIQINNQQFEPWRFIRVGNRKPPMHLCPNTWQGWKKLEESFESSTLRDEIRWTRICIQYCSTADEKVLDELKTWLEKMNPIQRIVMVNNYFGYNENLPNSKKLYDTIQSFKDKK